MQLYNNEDDQKRNKKTSKTAEDYWINRTFQEEEEYESETGDDFRQGGGVLDLYAAGHRAAAGPKAAEEPQYAQPHVHLDRRPVRRNSSLLERIRAAGDAPVMEGGLWSYGKVPPGRPLPTPVTPDKVQLSVYVYNA